MTLVSLVHGSFPGFGRGRSLFQSSTKAKRLLDHLRISPMVGRLICLNKFNSRLNEAAERTRGSKRKEKTFSPLFPSSSPSFIFQRVILSFGAALDSLQHSQASSSKIAAVKRRIIQRSRPKHAPAFRANPIIHIHIRRRKTRLRRNSVLHKYQLHQSKYWPIKVSLVEVPASQFVWFIYTLQ